MIIHNDPPMARAVLRYHRRRLRMLDPMFQREELEAARKAVAELSAWLRRTVGDDDISTPEAWRATSPSPKSPPPDLQGSTQP